MKGQITNYDQACYSTHDGLHFRLGDTHLWEIHSKEQSFVVADLVDDKYTNHHEFEDLADALTELRVRNREEGK